MRIDETQFVQAAAVALRTAPVKGESVPMLHVLLCARLFYVSQWCHFVQAGS